MSPVETLVTPLINSVPALVLAALGGIVQLMHSKKEITIKEFLAGTLTALFAGALMFLFLHDFGMSLAVKGAIVGLTGYASGEALPAAAKALCAYIGKMGGTIPQQSITPPTSSSTGNKSQDEC